MVQIPKPTIHIELILERRVQLLTQKSLEDITKYLLELSAITSVVIHLITVEALSF